MCVCVCVSMYVCLDKISELLPRDTVFCSVSVHLYVCMYVCVDKISESLPRDSVFFPVFVGIYVHTHAHSYMHAFTFIGT